METKSHWRTIIAFLVIPIIFLGVFGISYEFKEFDEILRWISETQADKVIFKPKSFVQHEYGFSFPFGLVTTAILIMLLTIK